jgi:hypothetical protein
VNIPVILQRGVASGAVATFISIVDPASLSGDNQFTGNNTFTATTTFEGQVSLSDSVTFSNSTINGTVRFSQPVLLPIYNIVELPDPEANEGGIVYVANESGGAVPAFSDGTNWRRVTDRAIIS